MTRSHRKCGFCQGVLPVADPTCPYCGKSLENPGALGRLLEQLLPDERPITKLLTALTVGVYALLGLTAGGTALISPSTYTLIHFGASFPPYIVEGQWWRLITSIFLHGDILHIGFNLYALWLIGPLIENSFGKARYLAIFVLTGLCSTLLSFSWGFISFDLSQIADIPFLTDAAAGVTIARPSVGMSGALTGLIGVGVAAGHRVKTLQGAQIRNVMLRWMAFIAIFGIVVPQVDNAAHFGGFIAGLAMGAVLPLKDRASLLAGRLYAALATACAGVIAAALILHGLSMPLDYPPDLDFYPTGIFGQTLREADRDDRELGAVDAACTDALNALETGDLDEATRRQKGHIAHINCDELSYLIPIFGEGYLRSAQGRHYDGDNEGACARLETAHLFHQYTGPRYKDPAFLLRIRLVAQLAGCPLPPIDASADALTPTP